MSKNSLNIKIKSVNNEKKFLILYFGGDTTKAYKY